MRCRIVTEHLIILNLIDVIPENLELDDDTTSHFVIHKYVKKFYSDCSIPIVKSQPFFIHVEMNVLELY